MSEDRPFVDRDADLRRDLASYVKAMNAHPERYPVGRVVTQVALVYTSYWSLRDRLALARKLVFRK